MLGIKTSLKNAEKIKKVLLDNTLLDRTHKYFKKDNYIVFPITSADSLNDIANTEIIQTNFKKSSSNKSHDLKTLLKDKLTVEELTKLKTAHDTIGTIAILEIDEDLRNKENVIAETLLTSNKNIKTVLRKDGSHEGVFRTQKMKWLAGENTKETIHSENGIKLKLDVETVYFSPRLSTERKRICQLVQPEEDILVMFSGCAPYPCALSKNTLAKEIVGVEINPEGHKYGLENISLNKLKNVYLINEDVRKELPEFKENKRTFDRILMPLPKTAEEFLDVTIPLTKKGTVIHMYAFYHETEFQKAVDEITKYCNEQNKEYKLLNIVKCGQHAPQVYRICVDFEMLN